MATEKRGRAAAWAGAAIFVVVAGVQFSAALHEALGTDPPPASDLFVADLTGLLALVAAAVLLVRVGYWCEHVPFQVGLIGARWVAYVGLGGAVLGFGGQMSADWYIAGPVNLILALLAFAVVRSELPGSPTSRSAPTRKGEPGSPTTAR